MKEYFNNIYKARYVLLSLTYYDLKNKYRGSILGIMWAFFIPLCLALIIGRVYSATLQLPLKVFVPYLFSGLIPWLYIVSCADGGTQAFLVSEGYIKQTRIPIEIFPLRVTLTAFVNLLFSLLSYFVIYFFISPEKFSPKMLMVFPALGIWFIVGISLSTIVAVFNVYFRDYALLQPLIFQALFFATPILFPAELLKNNNSEWIYSYNPVYYLLEILRAPLLGNESLDKIVWVLVGLASLIFFIAAVAVLKKVGRKIVFKL